MLLLTYKINLGSSRFYIRTREYAEIITIMYFYDGVKNKFVIFVKKREIISIIIIEMIKQ